MKKSAINQQPSIVAKGPNPLIVQQIFERVAIFEAEQAAKIANSTEEVYQPIVDHGEAHRVAMENMTAAMARGDENAIMKHFEEARYHEQMQRQAGAQARQYFLNKASQRTGVQS